MPTESTLSYQDQLGEEQARNILWLWYQVKQHPMLALIVSLLLVILVMKYVLPMILVVLRRWGITELFGIAITTPPPNVRHQKENRVSLLGPGNVDETYRHIPLPKTLERMATSIEKSSTSYRMRCCVVCQDKNLVHHYAVLFYKRMEQTAAVDKYGWIYYAKPRDKNMELCIQNCCFESLAMHEDIQSPRGRFSAQMRELDNPNVHTLLVIEMIDPVPDTDHELRQIAEQKGLSLVLFASECVSGYDTINISEQGGNHA